MIWTIDIDGVITANPAVFSWFTYHLLKNENNNLVYVVSWRDGSSDRRRAETIHQLERFNIYYNELIMAPRKMTFKEAALWKVWKVGDLKADIWIDDEIKPYRRDLKMDLEELLPGVEKIWI